MGRNFVSGTRRRRIVAGVLASTMTMVAAVETASAQTGNFTCRASVIRAELPTGTTLLEPVASNRPNNPCVTDSDGLPSLNASVLGVGIQASLLQSSTSSTASGATSTATVADVRVTQLLGTAVRARVASSTASVGCVNGSPSFSSSSQVVGLTVNGQPIVVTGQPNQSVLGGLIILNQRIVTADRITRRAVVVNLGGLLRVVVAESIADVSGNPCAPPPPPPPTECSDGIDNDGDDHIDFVPPPGRFADANCESAEDDSEAPRDN